MTHAPEEPAADGGTGPLELSIVVPVRDEAGNILPLIDEIRAALAGVARYEIVYVDDGSRDATPGRLVEARARAGELRVYRHETSCGQSAALATGIRAARAPLIATLDGDGQNDPADIPALLSAWRTGGDSGPMRMLAGHRARRRDRWSKRAASRVANAVRSLLLGDATPDTGCGLKLFPREAFLALPYFDHMHRFLPALMLREGWPTVSVPVNHRPRERGRSKYGVGDRLWVGIVDLLGVMWLMRRRRRARVRSGDGS